jgi:hypothetical protein
MFYLLHMTHLNRLVNYSVVDPNKLFNLLLTHYFFNKN